MDFKKYYPTPFSFTFSKVFTKEHSMAFDFPLKMLFEYAVVFKDEQKQKTIDILNGDSNKKLEFEDSFLKYIPENSTIYLFGPRGQVHVFLIIRGWGNLTGTGGHNLSPEVAAQIQDSFGNWIVNKLTGKEDDK